MDNKFTRQAQNALKLAKNTAKSSGHGYIGTEHLLVGLLKEQEGTAGKVLQEFEVEEDRLMKLISELITLPQGENLTKETEILKYSPRSERILNHAHTDAEKRQFAPTDKSSSPTINAKVIPIPIDSINVDARKIEVAFVTVKKYGDITENTAIINIPKIYTALLRAANFIFFIFTSLFILDLLSYTLTKIHQLLFANILLCNFSNNFTVSYN